MWDKRLVVPPMGGVTGVPGIGASTTTNVLAHINCFILLDLLGDPTSTIYNLNPGTSWMFDRLVGIQGKLAGLQLLSPVLQSRLARWGTGIFNSQLHPGGKGIVSAIIWSRHEVYLIPILHSHTHTHTHT